MPPLLLGLLRQFIVLLPMILVLSHVFDVKGVWASSPASDVLSTIISVTALAFELRHLNKRHKSTLELAAARAAPPR